MSSAYQFQLDSARFVSRQRLKRHKAEFGFPLVPRSLFSQVPLCAASEKCMLSDTISKLKKGVAPANNAHIVQLTPLRGTSAG